jgi:GT2 family glycosyltransferase/ubiquinone/menaquinone biosynthesis C-methylase UbiE
MVSIIIPVYNNHKWTEWCLQAVARNTKDYEVIVIDNGSNPKVELFVDMPIRIIRNESNLGFPAAVNQGINESKGDVICLLNNDVIVTPNWIDWTYWHFDKLDVLGPCTNYCAGDQQVKISFYEDDSQLDSRAVDFHKKNEHQFQETNFIIGFCMLFKKSLYDEIGRFDDSLWPCSGEEIDFCFRARQKGYNVGFVKDVYLHHEGSKTFHIIDEKYGDIIRRNNTHLRSKWGIGWYSQNGIVFDGERVIPDDPDTPKEVMLDHLFRYMFSLDYVVDKIVLDVACGTGYGSDMLASKAKYVYGFDISRPSIDYCKVHYSRPNLKYSMNDMRDIPFADSKFDVITCFEAIEHISESDGMKFLNETVRVLDDNGILIVSTPLDDNYANDNMYHMADYNKKEFSELLGKYFEEVKMYFQEYGSKHFSEVETNERTYAVAVCKKPRKEIL